MLSTVQLQDGTNEHGLLPADMWFNRMLISRTPAMTESAVPGTGDLQKNKERQRQLKRSQMIWDPRSFHQSVDMMQDASVIEINGHQQR